MALSRADAVMQSAQIRLRAYLDSIGYASLYEMREVYPDKDTDPPQATIVASMPEQDAAEDREIGGPLVGKRRLLLFDVIGRSESVGQNVANHVMECFESQAPLVLYDFSSDDPDPIDAIVIDNVIQNRLYFTNAAPWQEHWFTVTVAFDDEFNRPA